MKQYVIPFDIGETGYIFITEKQVQKLKKLKKGESIRISITIAKW